MEHPICKAPIDTKILKIALIGIGRMGQAVAAEAQKRGHEIVAEIDQDHDEVSRKQAFSQADVAIEFTQPEAVLQNIQLALATQTPMVTGTTGWYDRLDEVRAWCYADQGAILYASNFSIGVNLFFRAAAQLAQAMAHYNDYQVAIDETHHIHKKDAPSGTAITLAQKIMEQDPHLTSWQLVDAGSTSFASQHIPITARREGEVFGMHRLQFDSEIDTISLRHDAKNRRGFALGAVQAAEWLVERQGFYSMDDFLNA